MLDNVKIRREKNSYSRNDWLRKFAGISSLQKKGNDDDIRYQNNSSRHADGFILGIYVAPLKKPT